MAVPLKTHLSLPVLPVLLVVAVLHYQPTQENPLLVVQKPDCGNGRNSTGGKCAKAAVIKGETSIGLPSVCYSRVDPGPCGRDLIRVYYDWKTNRCKHFSYSGCGGNANRFVSIKNCYHICNPGYRTRIMSKIPLSEVMTTTEECVTKAKRRVKLNVTSVQQIEVEM